MKMRNMKVIKVLLSIKKRIYICLKFHTLNLIESQLYKFIYKEVASKFSKTTYTCCFFLLQMEPKNKACTLRMFYVL